MVDPTVKKLRDLCSQAQRLRDAADDLCKQVTEQLDASRAAHQSIPSPTQGKTSPPRRPRRRSKTD